PWLLGQGEPRDPARLAARVGGVKLEWLLYAVGLVAVACVWGLIRFQALIGWLLGIFGAVLVVYVLGYAVTRLPRDDRDRIFAAMFLIVGSILFWALFEQAG